MTKLFNKLKRYTAFWFVVILLGLFFFFAALSTLIIFAPGLIEIFCMGVFCFMLWEVARGLSND